jgi:hypothetical protein
MMVRSTRYAPAVAAILFAFAVGVIPAFAEESEKKSGGVRVDDLPKPIPQAMEQLKRIGNTVGDEISKAASKTAGAVNKAIKGNKNDKPKDQK